MPRESRQAWRARNAATERGVDAAVAEVKAERRAAFESSRERMARLRAEWAAMPAVPVEQFEPGMRVADRRGRVGTVVRVNRMTVTVTDGWGEYRWPLDSIIAAKRVD